MLGRSSTHRVASSSSNNSPSIMGLFDKAKAGIAHTSMVPILGNKDLRLLQTLIAEEKSVLQSSTRVSADIHRSASALSAWGASEGADLEDVCSKAADMLSLVANGFEKFSERQVDIRSLWKEIRGMEETLDDTKKRRKAVGSRSEREEKKLVKMSSENKNLPAQTELLQSLRDEMRELDTEIMNSEASLSDFKRKATKDALSIKFGGLLELAEKATIVGELGKLLLEEIPLEITPPGYGRAPYNSFDKTNRLVVEANKCASQVHFNRAEVNLVSPQRPTQTRASTNETGAPFETYQVYSNEDPELPARFSKDPPQTNLSAVNPKTGRSTSARPQSDQPRAPAISSPPLSPAAAYRDSFQSPRTEPASFFGIPPPTSPIQAPDATVLSGPPAVPRIVRDDGYGNEIPAGEEQHDGLAELGLGVPLATPDLTGQPPRFGPRLSLGLGHSVGNGELLNQTYGSNEAPAVSSPTYHSSPQGSASYDPPPTSYAQEPPQPIRQRPQPPRLTTAENDESLLAYDEPVVDGGSTTTLELPRPAFAAGRAPTPVNSEGEVFVDAREGMAPGSRKGSVDEGHLAHTQSSVQSDGQTSPPQPYHQPLPKPPVVITDASYVPVSSPTYPQPNPPTRFNTASSIPIASDSPISITPSPRPYSQQIDPPTDEHSLAAAAAQREVEREMDNLAFSSRSGAGNARGTGKINAGAFFKRSAAGATTRGAGGFVPPQEDVSDDGLSEDGASSVVKPLNIRRKDPIEGSEAVTEVAPPYAG